MFCASGFQSVDEQVDAELAAARSALSAMILSPSAASIGVSAGSAKPSRKSRRAAIEVPL